MKHFVFIITLALASFNSHAQSYCDTLTFYGVEDDFTVYASAYTTSITVSGNWEGESVLLAEANENVVGVYNNNPTNFLPYESLTICTMTMNTLCCDTYVWIGPTMIDGEWVIEIGNNEPTWICSPNGIGCYDVMDGSGEYGSLNDCEANCTVVIEDSWNCLNDACIDPQDGTGIYSSLNVCEQECQSVSSIYENDFNVNIYPNPSSNIFNLEFYSDTKSKIIVTNVLGEQVYIESTKSVGEFKTQIDLSNYSKGIYNLTIKTSDGISNHKLILQ